MRKQRNSVKTTGSALWAILIQMQKNTYSLAWSIFLPSTTLSEARRDTEVAAVIIKRPPSQPPKKNENIFFIVIQPLITTNPMITRKEVLLLTWLLFIFPSFAHWTVSQCKTVSTEQSCKKTFLQFQWSRTDRKRSFLIKDTDHQCTLSILSFHISQFTIIPLCAPCSLKVYHERVSTLRTAHF